MFDWIKDILANTWKQILPCEVVDPYEGGVVLRLGIYHRPATPGLMWKWPFAERVILTPTCTTTLRLSHQTLVSFDSRPILISAIIKYKVIDPQKYLLEVWDINDAMADLSMGVIARAVGKRTFQEVLNHDRFFMSEVVRKIRAAIKPYGIRVEFVTFIDIAPVRAIRLLGDVAPHGGGHSA